MDLLDRQLRHDQWATAQLLELSRGLTDEQLDQPFDIGHQSLRATFEHMIYYVGFWTAYMTGQPVPERSDDHALVALIDHHERTYPIFAALARQLRDEQRLDDTFLDHYGERVTCGATILHVIVHNVQHRAEARHILERLGVPDLPEGDPQEWEWAHEPHGA